MTQNDNADSGNFAQFRSPALAFEYIAEYYGKNKEEVIRNLKVWDTTGELEYLTIFEIYLRIERELGMSLPE